MSKRLPVTFDEETYEKFKDIAAREDKSMSQIINQYVKILTDFNITPQIMIFSNLNSRLKTSVFIEGNEVKPIANIAFEHKGGHSPYISIDYATEHSEEGFLKRVMLGNKKI